MFIACFNYETSGGIVAALFIRDLFIYFKMLFSSNLIPVSQCLLSLDDMNKLVENRSGSPLVYGDYQVA